MTVYFVSRHPGALEWAATQGLVVDRGIEHLDVVEIAPGDRVIGTLPVNIAAEICDRGGHYHHLSLKVPQELRGKELSVAEMIACGARLEEYHIAKIESQRPAEETRRESQ
ncbi:MAG: CRISPR-associated protein Csx16 [Magnetococcales bacterium]|nr:CRISPR-associated protein Csx16 [Magnetococcales bacterium]MBF0149793.1 CRISPR-associated protein Csx16 [Magnetococcales bacterium]MBF0348689.1 CRISPR-associated protein Csx16 [Magnetococcales bacterium]